MAFVASIVESSMKEFYVLTILLMTVPYGVGVWAYVVAPSMRTLKVAGTLAALWYFVLIAIFLSM